MLTKHSNLNHSTQKTYLYAERVTVQHEASQRLVFSHTHHEGKTAEFVDGIIADI